MTNHTYTDQEKQEMRQKYFNSQITVEEYVEYMLSSPEGDEARRNIQAKVEEIIERNPWVLMKQFKLTKKQHKKLLPNRQIKWYNKYKYYYNTEKIYIVYYSSSLYNITSLLMYPFYLLMNGVINIKELNKEYKQMFNEEIMIDTIEAGTDNYDKIMEVIGKENK